VNAFDERYLCPPTSVVQILTIMTPSFSDLGRYAGPSLLDLCSLLSALCSFSAMEWVREESKFTKPNFDSWCPSVRLRKRCCFCQGSSFNRSSSRLGISHNSILYPPASRPFHCNQLKKNQFPLQCNQHMNARSGPIQQDRGTSRRRSLLPTHCCQRLSRSHSSVA